MTLAGTILLVMVVLIFFLITPPVGAKPDPRFPKAWHGVFTILTGLAISYFGASGVWRGAKHRESDLDTAVFIILAGFVVSLAGFALLAYRWIRSRRNPVL